MIEDLQAEIDRLTNKVEQLYEGAEEQRQRIKRLERELNAANAEIEEKRKDVVWLATEKAKLENYVMLLEEAGDAMMSEPCEYTFEQWIKAKEDKP